MPLDSALHQLLAQYTAAVREAEAGDDDETAEVFQRRREVVSRWLGRRLHEQNRREDARRRYERNADA
jgi:hypothetical protein